MTTSNTECLIAETAETLSQVYSLRYECYRRKGSIPENAEQKFSDSFDRMPNSFSFLVRDAEKQAMATVRITVVKPQPGWTDSPVTHVYGDHPAFQAIANESFVEASRLCFGPLARRDAFVGLVGHMAAMADYHRVEWLVACPRVEHSSTYQRMFGFRPLAAPRKYFGVSFETQLLGIRVEELRNYVSNTKALTAAWSAAYARLTAPAVSAMLRAG